MANNTKKLSVVDSILTVFKVEKISKNGVKKNRLKFKPFIVMGYLKGAPIPLITFCMIHFGINHSLTILFWIAAFGLLFSCITVVMWGAVAFGGRLLGWLKAIGFVGIVEGSMTSLCWVDSYGAMAISLLCLALLVFINGTATACNLIADSRACKAAARVG